MIEIIKADRDRLSKIGDAKIAEGYGQAVREICEKIGDDRVAAVIEQIWLGKDPS